MQSKPEQVWARIEAELEYAHQSRADGNEGMARVCARRAAGWAVGTYQRQRLGLDKENRSAYVLLLWLQDQDAFKPEIRQAAARLTVQINPSHDLPHPEDPLLDAQRIIDAVREFQKIKPEG